MKARKNRTEIRGARAAHERDGVALARFFSWLEGAVRRRPQTELSVAGRLEAFRAEGEHYQGPSFNTISAFGSHGAIVHYGATEETDRRLEPRGLYLVDSGGQYLDGTTDITRTVLLGGRATREQKDHFTRVLKGHIAIARVRFPAGTSGQRIDALARTSLWEGGLDYGHGTGHGVGSYLAVHEGPIGIAPARALGVPLAEGHIVSNEPGYYRAGRYGIRTENLVLVSKDKELSRKDRTFLRFETISLCPIDRRLIDSKMLCSEERAWIDGYHAEVRRRLAPHLDGTPARWLDRSCRPL
jgi:Xaa-Pro aminopeptidase